MRHLINVTSLPFRKDISHYLLRLLLLASVICLAYQPVWAATLASVSMTTTPSNTAVSGRPVTLTATAVGGSNLQYKFMSDTAIIRDFSSSRTCIWTPWVMKTYNLRVIARDLAGVNSSAIVTSPVVNLVITDALSSVTMTTSPLNTVLHGMPVILTASAVGGANVEYKFLNGTDVLRGFSTSNTLRWIPWFKQTYSLTVVARDLSGVNPVTIVTSPVVYIVVKPVLSSVTMATTPWYAAIHGTSVTLTAFAVGGANVQYKFMHGSEIIREFSTSNTAVWKPWFKQTYDLTVVARDLSADPMVNVTSPIVYIAIKPALSSVTMTTSPLNAALYGTPVTLSATAIGGINVQYKFMSDSDIIRDFSSSDTYAWTPWVMRAYNLTVVTRDLAGVNPNTLITSPIVHITVKASLTVISGNGTVTRSPNLALYNYGTVVRLTANPAPNYHFIGWSGSQSSIYNPLDITMNSNKTITANYAGGPAPVGLGTSGNFAVLAKSGISTTGTTAIVGNIGVSPAALTYITGFSQTLDSSTTYATSIYVTGKIYAADMTSPTSSNLTTAISDMETAYTDAAGRPTPDFIELGTGDISGMTLAPGLYKWSSGVSVNSDVTLAGGPNAVWIFQIAGNLAIANGHGIILNGGAQDKNIFWQVAGKTTLGTGADLEGIVLCKTAIAMRTGAVLNGRALAQTAVTLDSNDVTKPD